MQRVNHFGGALLRLCAQWKRRKPARSQPRSAECFVRAGFTPERAAVEHAKDVRLCDEWLARQRTVLLAGLRETQEACTVLTQLARRWQVPHPDLTAGAVLRYWVDSRCGHCDGERQVGGKVCPVCFGTGVATLPYGPQGARLVQALERARAAAERSLRRRLGAQKRERGRHAHG